jgi:hypothetical protein
VITGCVLEYSGQPLILEATSFLGCSFRLQGDTASTFDLVDCFKSMPGDAATYSMDATKSFLQKDPKGLH